MLEFQQDQRGKRSYRFKDDSNQPTNVHEITVTSSNESAYTVEPIPQTEPGLYQFYLNWAGVGVGELSMTAKRLPDDTNPITDLVAVSTIPNVAEGVETDFETEEL